MIAHACFRQMSQNVESTACLNRCWITFFCNTPGYSVSKLESLSTTKRIVDYQLTARGTSTGHYWRRPRRTGYNLHHWFVWGIRSPDSYPTSIMQKHGEFLRYHTEDKDFDPSFTFCFLCGSNDKTRCSFPWNILLDILKVTPTDMRPVNWPLT